MDLAEFRDVFPYSDRFKGKTSIKIKFFAGTSISNNKFYVNLTEYSLKAWHDINSSNANKFIWLDSAHIGEDIGLDPFIREIEDEMPDILCFSLYVWSLYFYNKLATRIKQRFPNMMIVVGGPSVNAHKDDAFLDKYPWIDLAIYGDGEQAFSMLLDSLVDSSSLSDVPHNLCFKSENRIMVVPFTRLKDKQFSTVSPTMHCKETIARNILEYKRKYPDYQIQINWEYTRGCPYACSFCDWSSGLHHKVTRKKYDYKDDLKFYAELGVTVRWVDANVGMFKDDMDIIRYAWDLEDNFPMFELFVGNTAKLNKKWTFDMMDEYEVRRPLHRYHTISLQDINQSVLTLIDRPEIPWQEHKGLILDIIKKHPNIRLRAEIIIGLPGQTLEGFAKMLFELIDSGMTGIIVYFWTLLPNSPAYDLEYRMKHGLVTAETFFIEMIDPKIKTRDKLIESIESSDYTFGEMVIGTNSADFKDIMAMYAMSTILPNFLKGKYSNFKKLMKPILLKQQLWQEIGNEIASNLLNDLKEKGKIYLAMDTDVGPKLINDYLEDERFYKKIFGNLSKN